jgi:hypothetical protein
LNAVCPDGFEYYFVDEEFVVDREYGLINGFITTSNDYTLTVGHTRSSSVVAW